MAELGEPPATTADRYPTMSDPFLDLSETRLEVLKPDLFLEPFDPGLVSLHSPATSSSGLSGRDLQAHPNPLGRTAQPYPGIQQILVGPIPLVVGRTRDSASQRLDASAVRARLRSARWSSPGRRAWPSRQRPARSAPARRPRYTPTAHTTASSVGARRSRVRTLAPVGGAMMRRCSCPTAWWMSGAGYLDLVVLD